MTTATAARSSAGRAPASDVGDVGDVVTELDVAMARRLDELAAMHHATTAPA